MASCEFSNSIAGLFGSDKIVLYGGDSTPCDHKYKFLKTYAELAINVYNNTHLFKYSFVELVHVTGHYNPSLVLDMIFTVAHVKHEPEKDADDPITFRARVVVPCHYVDYVDFQNPQENLETMLLFPENDNLGSVLYDRDHPTFCNGETVKIVNKCADLALEVYNKTQWNKYILLELVHATGCSSESTGFMVDMMFTAKCVYPQTEDDRIPKTLRTRVSTKHKYVELLRIVPHARSHARLL